MNSSINIQIGEAIRIHLESRGLLQRDVAEALNITQGAVSAYYRGKPFGKNAAQKWSNAFGFRVNWLLTGEGSMLKDSPQPKLAADQIPSLSSTELLLRDLLTERDNEIRALQEIIWELKEEIGRLKNQLEHKGETAHSAGGSSVANAG